MLPLVPPRGAAAVAAAIDAVTYYAKTDGYFSSSRTKGDISTPANAGVYTLEIGTSPDQSAGAGANYFIDGESVGQTGEGGREGSGALTLASWAASWHWLS